MPDMSMNDAAMPWEDKINKALQLVLGTEGAHERSAGIDALLRLVSARGLHRSDLVLIDATQGTYGLMRVRIDELQRTVDKLRKDKINLLKGKAKPRRKPRRAGVETVVLAEEEMERMLAVLAPEPRKRATALAAALNVSVGTARRCIRSRTFSKLQHAALDASVRAAGIRGQQARQADARADAAPGPDTGPEDPASGHEAATLDAAVA